jgi:hypothetical protein
MSPVRSLCGLAICLLLIAMPAATSSRGTGYRNLRDFDGDHITDLTVVRVDSPASQAVWYVRRSSDGAMSVMPWGTGTDHFISADFDGDGLADHTVTRRIGPTIWWYTRRSTDGGLSAVGWGSSANFDPPLIGDFDADGKADVAVYRFTDWTFYARKSSDGSMIAQPWGGNNNGTPVIGDWDGDGRSDFGVFGWNVWNPLPPAQFFYLLQSTAGVAITQWGSFITASDFDKPIFGGDYDGDGKDDLAVVRHHTANPHLWFVRLSSTGAMLAAEWGTMNEPDFPTPGDYDGDGKWDIAVYRASNPAGYYYIRRTSDGSLMVIQWGGPQFLSVGHCQLSHYGCA